MKTKFTLLSALILVFFGLNAQTVANGGFENWSSSTPSVPTGWSSYDALVQAFGGGSIPVKSWCTKETTPANVFAGTSACKLMTDSTSAPVGLIGGAVFSGGLALVAGRPTQSGTPFTGGRPTTFNYSIKIPSTNNSVDTAFYQVILTHWDAAHDSTIVVAAIGAQIWATGNAYHTFSDSLQYFDASTPDSVYLQFQSSAGDTTLELGATLWIDNLSFTFPNTGIVHLNADDAVQLFPNPTASQLTLKVDDYMVGYTMSIYNLQGQLAKRTLIEGSTSTIQVGDLSNGAYMYRLTDKEGNMAHQSKFVVAK